MKNSERPSVDLEQLAATGVPLQLDAESIDEVSRDQGGVVASRPEAVASPESAEQVAQVVCEAIRQGCSIAVRGAGRSRGGQSLAPSPIAMDLGLLQPVPALEADSVWVGAGTSLRELTDILLPADLLPLPLPWGEGTAGGALSVAALGLASHAMSVAGRCLEIEAVTGTGDIVRCCERENRELFDCIRGGLGQFGIVTRVRLSLHRVPTTVTVALRSFPDLTSLVAELERLATSADVFHLEGRCVPALVGRRRVGEATVPIVSWQFIAEVVASNDSTVEGVGGSDVDTQELRLDQWLRPPEWLLAPPEIPGSSGGLQPWIDWLLPLEGGEKFVEGLLTGIPPEIVASGHLTLQVRRHDALPLLMQPDTASVLTVGLHCPIPRSAARSLLPLLERVSRLGRQAGGRCHLGGWLPFDGSAWKEHFGGLWPELCRAKRFYDPGAVLNPGVIPFEGSSDGPD